MHNYKGRRSLTCVQSKSEFIFTKMRIEAPRSSYILSEQFTLKATVPWQEHSPLALIKTQRPIRNNGKEKLF
jgi:hypothetical protein